MKRRKILWLFVFVLTGFLWIPVSVRASSGSVQLSSVSANVAKGDFFTVVCQVTSTDAFVDTSFQISYDDKILEFISGGKKVTGGEGMLQVASTGNSKETTKKTFSLQFRAKKKGSTLIAPDGAIKVTDQTGNAFSMSSNQLLVTVTKKGAVPVASPHTTVLPKVTPQPVLSSENRLKSLKVSAIDFSPAFVPDGKEYTATVDADTDTLYFSYVAQDEKSRVRMKGNEGLVEGENTVIVTVTAENGSAREYKIQVTKETRAETEKREMENAAETPNVGFSIRQVGNRTLLKNSYEFEVLNPDELDSIPAGYIQSTIELSGISVPAFTMEHDLDNNYLLLYLKGPKGDRTLYQYDRTEQTIQKYTGTMTERVNRGATADAGSSFPVSSYVLIGIIIFLIVIILCMLIAMLKMAIKRKKGELQ